MNNTTNDNYFAANKDIWNKRTQIHRDSSFYDRAGFIAGKDVLTEIERGEIGDVKGKRSCTCNAILEWIRSTLARMGAEGQVLIFHP
ncbi:MAG: hypothetical protein IPP73_12670 [Chitinophagaceae bacterium]|nr:hypothetical protein [Chitinophagaceae bacterium]